MSDPNPRVFISYSHDSKAHSKRVLALAQALRRNGIDVELDQYHTEEILDWPRWCRDQISRDNADFVLCICTAEYRRRIKGNVPPERGKGVYWEGSLLDDEIYNNKGNRRILPVLFDDEPDTSIIDFLRGWTYCRLHQFTLDDHEYKHMLRILTGQAAVEKQILGKIPNLPPESTAAASIQATPPSLKIRWTNELRIYGEEDLFQGRKAELKLLDKALAAGSARILSLWAEAGAGKTRLLVKWLTRVRDNAWPGLTSVFVHSFYSQGSSDVRNASSDTFFEAALAHFGYAGPIIKDPAEKGRRLAELITRANALLVLDGLEPLQYPPTDARKGELKDTPIQALILNLANATAGLCLVTTRQELPELKARLGAAVVQKPLNNLGIADGVRLLQKLEVKGPPPKLRQAVKDYHGHAYSLMLLGTYLREATGDHEIQRRHNFALLAEDKKHHARHIFEMYETHFGPKSPEIAVLRLLGFFDRPAPKELINILRAPQAVVYDLDDEAKQARKMRELMRQMGQDTPAAPDAPLNPRPVKDRLPDIAAPILNLPPADWQRLITRLTDLRLISVAEDESLDSHAILRQHFADQLQKNSLDAFRAGHRRLYEHLTGTTEYQPDTLPALQPLYQAVRHGCLAGIHQKACDEVYTDRILHGTGSDGFYTTRKLGAFGADLGAIASFFDDPWRTLSPNLSEPDQAWLLNAAAFRLRALGRLTDALEPMRAALQMAENQENWKSAAIRAGNLSELDLTLGLVAQAVADAERSVAFADRSADAFWRMASRTTHADALHQAGRPDQASTLFREAESIQAEDQPEYPRLYSLGGFQYSDLLLAEPERMADTPQPQLAKTDNDRIKTTLKAVSQRVREWFESRTPTDSVLGIALDHLTLARIELYRAIIFNSPLPACENPLAEAVNGLRESGNMDDLPRALLTLAWARFAAGDEKASREALDEAYEIADRGAMKLHMADINLYRARFFKDQKAQKAAADLIQETAYHRRDKQLADLKKALAAES